MEKHKALREAFKNMKERKPIDEAAKELEAEVIKHEAELRKYGGL
jgi:predicted regulator of amino acid metabolism with ACT domain